MSARTAVAIVAAGLAVAGAVHAFPGTNGRLAYFYANEIWVMNADGTGARSLGAGLSPSWSPNGRRLVFDAVVERNYDVWTMAGDGRARRRVTTNAAPDYFATWSPDGEQIAFTSDRGGEDLFAIDADGTDERRLTTDPGPEWGAAWSPDGARIAFAGNARGNLEIEVVSVDGSGRFALTDHRDRDYDPAWSPDGTRIAFTSERDGNANVYVMNADGSDERRLRGGDVNARDVDWQPTIDLQLRARRSGRFVVAQVTNSSPADARRVRVTFTFRRGVRVRQIGTIPAGATRTARVAASRRTAVLASGWQVDPNPADNRASVLRR